MTVAPNYTHVAAGATDSLIVGGSTCTVFGISVEGTSAGRVLIEEAGTTTVIMALDVVANGSSPWVIPFVAKAGLQVTTPAGITCTVFHSNAT